jgi:hypothetical protein
MAQLPEGVRVHGSMQFESQQIFGQVQKHDVTGGKTATQIRAALVQAGAL